VNRKTTTRRVHYFCSMPGGDPDCLRGWEHSGACKPGCRICRIDTHRTLDCPDNPDRNDDQEHDGMALYEGEHPRTPTGPFTYLPPECKTGKCDHAPDPCMRYRSSRCLSGECTHASKNLICGTTA